MNQDRWRQIDELFDAVLEIPEAERENFLSENAGGDEDLKAEVLSLLNAQNDAEKFMENSAMNLMGKALAGESAEPFDNSLYNKTFGNYKIEKPLAAGGMGEVYLAHDTKLDRKVALKILPKEYVSDEERVKRFEIEARAVSALNHPYIVTVYDVGKVDDVSYLATEYVEGKNVRDLMGNGLSLTETLSIISQTIEALAAAHKAGIIHRDIKPENIMVRPDGYVKVLDFGLAKLVEINPTKPELTAQTMKGAVIGTLAYMSPEQIVGDKIDHRTDLWSLGVVLYEMLTGKNPFKADNRQATFNSILSFEPPLPSELNPQISGELDRLLLKALEKDADLSYQSASDMHADLKRVRREIDSGTSLRSSGAYILSKTRRGFSRRIWLVAPLLLILLLGTGAFFWWRGDLFKRSEPSPWNNAVGTQLTDFAGVEDDPSLSPDGKTLVFARLVNGNWDIFWQRIGGAAQNLTADSPGGDTNPAFSPDGEHIAFRSGRSGGGIFIMGATGEAVKRLTDFGNNPAWSPDGKEIVFSTVAFSDPISRGNDGALWAVNVASGATRRIETGVDALQPQFSPSGKRIVFWGKDEKYQRDLWTVSASGGDAARVTNDEALDWNPVWSPDGKYLYFCSNRSGGSSLWRIPFDETTGAATGEPEAVVAPLAQSYQLTLSKDGKNLVYVRRQRTENVQKVDFDSVKMQVVGKPVFITQGSKRARTVDVSPDGKHITFYITGEGQEDIYLVKTDDLKSNQLTNDEARDRVPRFSPDGSRIVFYSNASGNYEIWSINLDGSDRRKLTEFGGRGLQYPIWSPDGSRIVCSMFNSGNPIIFETGKAWAEQTPQALPALNEKGDRFVAWSWSPDGKKLAGWRADANVGEYPEIYLFSFETNGYQKIADNAFRAMWFPDSRYLLIAREDKLFMLDSQTGNARELLSLVPQEIDNPVMSRDGKRIFYGLITTESDIQMLSLKE